MHREGVTNIHEYIRTYISRPRYEVAGSGSSSGTRKSTMDSDVRHLYEAVRLFPAISRAFRYVVRRELPRRPTIPDESNRAVAQLQSTKGLS